MTPPTDRRQARAGQPMPTRDAAAYRSARRRERWRTGWVVAAFLVGLAAMAFNVWTDEQNDRQAAQERRFNADRDDARKYQACTQRGQALVAQNDGFRVVRDLLTAAARRQDELARTADTTQARARARTAATYTRKQRARIVLSREPRCRDTYPNGWRLRDRFPDLAKSTPPTRPRPQAPPR